MAELLAAGPLGYAGTVTLGTLYVWLRGVAQGPKTAVTY